MSQLAIHLGARALDDGGVRVAAHSDDILAGAFERTGLVLVELVRIRRHIAEPRGYCAWCSSD
jgi:hypothetical protein